MTPVSDIVSDPDPQIIFASMGMVVLDAIQFASGKSLSDVIGGSGAYSTLGARIFQQPSSASSIGWLIKAGPDFPKASRVRLESWGTSLVFQERQNRQTTRGRLVYKDTSHTGKSFEYTSTPLLIGPRDFAGTSLLHSRCFHMLAGPLQVVQDINELMALRRSAHIEAKPLIVWEPRPSSCTPEYLPLFQEAARLVDVFSPNHIELAAIFSKEAGEVDPRMIMRYADKILQSGIGIEGQGYVVVRSGEQGCFVTSKQVSFWSPAYYEDGGGSEKSDVVDPTGAGNAFLGAFAIGLLQTNLIYQAACYGAVGASFALEQIGVPEKSSDKDGVELWNGDNAFDRLKRYQERFSHIS